MPFKEAFKRLEKSETFGGWKAKNKNCVLAHALMMLEGPKQSEWQIGFYNPKTDKAIVFSMMDSIQISPETEIFKKPKTKIIPIDMKKLKIDAEEALIKAKQVLQTDFSPEKETKIIVILQNVEKKQMWNITFITESFNVVNVRISTENGAVIGSRMASLYSFGKSG